MGDDFAMVLQEALDSLPDEFRSRLDNIEVVVEDEPEPDIKEEFGDALLLGLYQGIPMTKRTHYYSGVLPDKISIYRKALLRISRSRRELVENIKKTLLHELGHYFGINDKRLRELGY